MKKELVMFEATDAVTASPVEDTLFVIDYQAWHAKKQQDQMYHQVPIQQAGKKGPLHHIV